VVIGKKGADIEKLRGDIAKMTSSEVSLNIVEIPEARNRRETDSGRDRAAAGTPGCIPARDETRGTVRDASGRARNSHQLLGPAWRSRDRADGMVSRRPVPLHTLRADVDFGYGTAHTTYGTCGVKVWVFKGEVMTHDPMAQDKRLAEQPQARA